MALTFRDTLRRISPPWLQGHWSAKLLYAVGVHLDAMADASIAAVKLRFPGVYSNETLSHIGRERGIWRGLEETEEAYQARLLRWWDDRKRKGSPYALMHQLQGILGPHKHKIRVINQTGGWYTLHEDGSTEYQRRDWNWDSNTGAWSRFWVVIYPPSALWKFNQWSDDLEWGQDDLNWGPFLIDDGTPHTPIWFPRKWGAAKYKDGQWGSSARKAQVEMVRELIREWQAAHAHCLHIIIALDPDSFDPVTTDAEDLPNGDWGNWSRTTGSGHRTRSRLRTARYWKGT